MQTLSQAAEAIIKKDGDRVIKERIPKRYRHVVLDESLRKFRTKREAKILQRLAEHAFPVPKVLSVDEQEMKIEMQFIDGKQLKETFSKNYLELAKEIGKKIAQMHNLDIVHGDLTTANMIISKEVFFIDFGLAQFSDKYEDKAVDLHLLENALEAVHFECYPECFKLVLEEYEKEAKDSKLILERLERVRERGRNKQK